MVASLVITVDADEVIRLMRRAEDALDLLVAAVADELAEESAREGGQISSRLGQRWPVEGTGDEQRTVEAPEWWAHFVAGGTKPHGPVHAPRLVFAVDGRVVSAHTVSGTAADPFDERAIRATESRVDDIIARLIGGLD
jgi:hypothetical protein